MEQIKNHLSLVVTLITLVAALFAFDARYAHASETKRQQQTTNEKIEETQRIIHVTTYNLRRAALEDKVFELEVKEAQRKLTPIDSALKERYLRQLKDIPSK